MKRQIKVGQARERKREDPLKDVTKSRRFKKGRGKLRLMRERLAQLSNPSLCA